VNKDNRIKQLDGLRCLCITLVIAFHYFYAYPNYLPYHNKFANFYLVRYGYLGVNCFFIISGFVIYMTLQKCKDIRTFFIRRFIRLWPTLLICTTLTFIVVNHSDVDSIKSHLHYFWCALTITDPVLWTKLLKFKSMYYIDPVEWSLICEVVFYFTASILYFINKQKFFTNWLLYTATIMAIAMIVKYSNTWFNTYITAILQPNFISFFTIGIYFFNLYTNSKMPLKVHLAAILLFFLQLILFQNLKEIAFLISFVALFLLFIYKSSWTSLLSSRIMAYVGQISYTLYLTHNYLGIVLIITFSKTLNSISPFIIIPPALIIILIGSIQNLNFVSSKIRN
jgi:peptidoglycan/LPS O-acetylase OafA/YrhL